MSGLSAPPPPPQWLTVIVVLVLLGLLGYNIIVVGPEGLPTSYILGGLLATYGGIRDLLLRQASKRDRDGDGP